MNIEIYGIDNLYNEIDFKLKNIKFVQKIIVEKILGRLKKQTPVETGAARDAWKINISPFGMSIENEKEYISELNDGSSQQAPSYFIEREVLGSSDVKAKGSIVRYS